ncbi:MAG TPA: TIGR03067 domain-containing protein [Tepidisphaeraceae bacterium]|jgi:uncharacterized protein (TIGR03067 family)|nr:TIGR03067 domain-containing protein [Tepidisphaeraceae bacterium]
MRNLKLLAALMLCASLALLARAEEGKKTPPAKSDKELLQGTWKVVKKTKGGEAEDVKDNPMTIKFAGDVATATMGGETKGEGTFTIDESKSHRWITLTGTSGPNAGREFAAIYELDGDTLKLAYSTGENNKTRPKDFSGKEGEAAEVLERQKP